MNMNMSVQILNNFMAGGIPDQHQLQESKTEYREHSRWVQAILTTVHRYQGPDLAPGLAAEGRREYHWENCKIEAGRRADVQGGRAWYVSCICPRHC